MEKMDKIRKNRWLWEGLWNLTKIKVVKEFEDLIGNISSKYILTSYRTEGNIPLTQMMNILGSKGSISVVKREYVRYRVSPIRLSPKPRNIGDKLVDKLPPVKESS